MILLDTNVISEIMRPAPSPAVQAWLAGQPPAGIFITSLTEAELRYGAALLPRGQRREKLVDAIEAMLAQEFVERVLPFDSAAAVAYAQIAAGRRQIGRPISQFDAQIAAIVRSRGAALATRNVADFDECGIQVIDPWNA